MRLELHISGNGLTDDTRILEGNLLEVGRAPDVAWSLPDSDATELVSAVHLRMTDVDGVSHVEDAGSTNGTFLNGTRLTERTSLTIGDRLELGAGGPVVTVLSVQSGEAISDVVQTTRRNQPLPVRTILAVVGAIVLIGVTIGRETHWFQGQGENRKSSASDSQRQDDSTVPVELANSSLAAVQTRPLAMQDDAVTVEAGKRSIIDVLANDGSGSASPPLVVKSVSESRLGAVVEISSDGRNLVYSAPSQGSGHDRLTYRAADAAGSSEGTAVLDIDVKPAVADLAEYSEAVAWIGFSYHDEIHADECGWFVSPSRVVTSGRAAAGLKLLKDRASDPLSIGIIVMYDNDFLPVDRITLHPGYEVSDPGARNSLACDVGLLHLSRPASSVHPCVIDSAVPETTEPGTELRTIGFVNQTGLTDLHDPTRVRQVQTSLPVTGSVTGTFSAAPILTSSMPYSRGMSGAPVFNAAGRVTGVVSHFDDRLIVVPARALTELLQ